MYKFLTKDNRYDSYQYVETRTFQPIETIPKTPLDMKLFPNDIFDYDADTGKYQVIHSNFKANRMIPGILDLTMTHGRDKKNQKFLYLCKPDDKRIPFFLVAYSIPQSFDKSLRKLYITFEFKHWEDKRPRGTMTQNLGNIHELACFYEYVLYCKSLNVSIQAFTKEAKKKLHNQSSEEIIQKITEKYSLEERTKSDYYIFTLDSIHSNDYDDALSYHPEEHKISIYISNVALIMEHLELWESFSNRISTIYLPDRKRTMLPPILVDSLCSLREKENKLCYVLDVYYDEHNEIRKQELKLCKAYIRKNMGYENMDSSSIHIQHICRVLNVQHPKQIVSRLMLHFNHYVATTLASHKKGVFKTLFQETNHDVSLIQSSIPQDVYHHICILKTNASNYCTYHDDMVYQSITHKKMDHYVQATSPIRRLVDVLNNIAILELLGVCPISVSAKVFYQKWTTPESMECINVSSRAIRKIQSKCRIYQQYETNKQMGRDIMYEGYVFDKIKKEGDGKYQYMVYIRELNLTTYITLLQDLEEYSCHLFSLYVFMSEENEKKKVKLQLCYEEE